MIEYHVNVLWSDEARCYVADVPDLKACSAFGATPQEALAEVRLAERLWLQAARVLGQPIPFPLAAARGPY